VNGRGSRVERGEVREERRSEQYSLAKILGIWARLLLSGLCDVRLCDGRLLFGRTTEAVSGSADVAGHLSHDALRLVG
jgi:hypothetical protein